MPAAYFDMDGTLLKGDSNDFLVRYLLKEQVQARHLRTGIAECEGLLLYIVRERGHIPMLLDAALEEPDEIFLDHKINVECI